MHIINRIILNEFRNKNFDYHVFANNFNYRFNLYLLKTIIFNITQINNTIESIYAF
jgi:hypothetical protein